jgi:hypothetical protein
VKGKLESFEREFMAMEEELDPSLENDDQRPLNIRDRGSRWIIGLPILLVGGILLVQNLAGRQIDRWWFILLIIPSIGAFMTAWSRYRAFGRSQRNAVVRPVVIGLIFLLATVILLFDLSGQMILPLILILVGLIAFVSILLR